MTCKNNLLVYVWDERVLYMGPSFEPRSRQYGSAALVVGLEKPVIFHRTGKTQTVERQLVLLPPGLPVHIDAGGEPIAVFFLDVFKRDFHYFQGQSNKRLDQIYFEFENEKEYVDAFIRIYESFSGIRDFELSELIPYLENPKLLTDNPVDVRVVQAIKMLRDLASENCSTETIAKELNLSVPRVIQLFRKYVGVPVGRYRQWNRLHSALLDIALGGSFTEAAIDAGFTDQAHYCKTFKNLLGLKPSMFLAEKSEVSFFVDPILKTEGFNT